MVTFSFDSLQQVQTTSRTSITHQFEKQLCETNNIVKLNKYTNKKHKFQKIFTAITQTQSLTSPIVVIQTL